jgi:hypothetical protein
MTKADLLALYEAKVRPNPSPDDFDAWVGQLLLAGYLVQQGDLYVKTAAWPTEAMS